MKERKYKIKVIKVTEKIKNARLKFRSFIERHAKNERFVFYTGGSFLITPVLVVILLICKNVFFNIARKNGDVMEKITQERIKSAQMTLDFAQYQNHQKVLDLQNQYITEYSYINSGNIIEESQMENL